MSSCKLILINFHAHLFVLYYCRVWFCLFFITWRSHQSSHWNEWQGFSVQATLCCPGTAQRGTQGTACSPAHAAHSWLEDATGILIKIRRLSYHEQRFRFRRKMFWNEVVLWYEQKWIIILIVSCFRQQANQLDRCFLKQEHSTCSR